MVSIHAPARGATRGLPPQRRRKGSFNPRSRAGSDLESGGDAQRPAKFQSTLPRGERPMPKAPTGLFALVSIHAPARGATGLSGAGQSGKLSFNPRSRAGSDSKPRCNQCPSVVSIHAPARGATMWMIPKSWVLDVSIHAPARGATDKFNLFTPIEGVSIHAPARGATPATPTPTSETSCFNPRSRAGSDANQTEIRQ